MSYSLSPLLKPRFFVNATNKPLVGGKLYTYLAETTTPATTYSNDTGTPNTNPIILDTNGECNLYLGDDKVYRLILKDANDVTYFDKDRVSSIGGGDYKVLTFDTIADLRLKIGSEKEPVAQTSGYYNAGDGGGNRFYWDGTSAATDNGGTIIKPTFVSGAGRRLAIDLSCIYPEQFGAKANGLIDDSPVLTVCLTAAYTNKSILILRSNKTYKCDSGLTVPSGVFIDGNNATLDFSAGHVTGLTFTNSGGIKNTTINGAGNSSANANGNAIYCVGSNSSNYVTAPTITGCNIKNWGFYGIYFRFTKNGLVCNNKITNIGYAAFAGFSCSFCVVDSNYIDDVSPGSSSNAYGITFSRLQNNEATDPRSVNCKITKNTIKNVTIWEGIDTHGGDNILIDGNDVTGCSVGIAIVGAIISGVESLGAKNCVVSNNYVSGIGTGAGIKVVGAMNGGALVEPATNCIVSSNTLVDCGEAGASLSGAIQIYATKNTTVNGNTILNAYVAGVNVYIYNSCFNVSANSIRDPRDNVVSVPSCVISTAGNNTGIISDNAFIFSNASLATYVAVYSVRITSGYTNNDICIGKNAYLGIDATHLGFSGSSLADVNIFGSAGEKGAATISINSGDSVGLLDITFVRRMPAIPKVDTIVTSSLTTVGKCPILFVSNITATGFRVLCRPSDLSTFSATGSVTVDWKASL